MLLGQGKIKIQLLPFLTTEAVVADIPEENPGGGGMPDMGGMGGMM